MAAEREGRVKAKIQLTDLQRFKSGDRVIHILSRRRGVVVGPADRRLWYVVEGLRPGLGPGTFHADELTRDDEVSDGL